VDARIDTDVAIIGGGPAGSATAITCAARGLRVHLFEHATFAGAGFADDRPGETLHPGVEPVLAQLGVADDLDAVVGARHDGIWIDWGGVRRFQSFGSDANGPWRGFQVSRAAFDTMLLDRARALGATIVQPCRALGLRFEGERVTGILTEIGELSARFVVDATGRSHWVARRLQINQPARSPRLIARYGYARGSCPRRDAAPALVGDRNGWVWTARVGPSLYQWIRVTAIDERPDAAWLPDELGGLEPLGPSRGADVTWRIADRVTSSGWFMVGDAAAVLDPTSSHGVLKAMLSGIAAAHLIDGVIAGTLPPTSAAATYQSWLNGWFANDAAHLSAFYRDIGMRGFGAPASSERTMTTEQS
jgi:flavin-dependent dehydrogenase